MTKPLFLCYFERSGDEWEGISVDYDIAVCGRSADEVKTLLKSAILSYIEDANKEEKEARERLLNRRVPKMLQLQWKLSILTHSWFSTKKGKQDFEDFMCRA